MFRHREKEQNKNKTSFATTPDTEEEAERTAKGLEAAIKKYTPLLMLLMMISAALSMLGVNEILPNGTEYAVFKAALYGGSIGLIQIVFWSFIFQRARDVETVAGLIIYLSIFFGVGTVVTVPSWFTNTTTLTYATSEILTNKQGAGELNESVREAKKTGAILQRLRRLLASQQSAYATRRQQEIGGIGGSDRPGNGHIANALLFVSGLYGDQVRVVKTYVSDFKALETRLDRTHASFQQQVKSNDFGTESYAESFASVTSVIAEINAINPKLIASSVADQVDVKLDIPSSAKGFQVAAIKGFERELAADTGKIRVLAKDFKSVEVPSVEVQSNFNVSLSQIKQQLPLAILALMIDILAPILFLGTLPAILKIIHKKRVVREKDNAAKNKADGEHMILTTDLVGFVDRQNVKKVSQYAQNNKDIADILQTGTVGNVTKPQDETNAPNSDADEVDDNPDASTPSDDNDADDKPYSNGKDHNSDWYGDGWKPSKGSDGDEGEAKQ